MSNGYNYPFSTSDKSGKTTKNANSSSLSSKDVSSCSLLECFSFELSQVAVYFMAFYAAKACTLVDMQLCHGRSVTNHYRLGIFDSGSENLYSNNPYESPTFTKLAEKTLDSEVSIHNVQYSSPFSPNVTIRKGWYLVSVDGLQRLENGALMVKQDLSNMSPAYLGDDQTIIMVNDLTELPSTFWPYGRPHADLIPYVSFKEVQK